MTAPLTDKARTALTNIANGNGCAIHYTRQMIANLSRSGLIDFDLDSFGYVLTDKGRQALTEAAR